MVILEQGANINQKDSFNRTPLHHAANGGNETAVELLIEHGLTNPQLNGQILDINAITLGLETALMKAAAIGHVNICRRLIDAQCNIQAKDIQGMTASDHAFSNQ